jgi:hypothetical protein
MLVSQDNKCAICGTAFEDSFGKNVHVDHDHKTGKVRGLLCQGCNHLLGRAKDDPQILLNAVDYLYKKNWWADKEASNE